MRHVNNVSTISLYEDGWQRFLDDGEMGEIDEIAWRVDYAGIDFRKQLHYRDDLRVGTRLAGMSEGRLRVCHILLRDGEIVGAAQRLVTPVDRHTGTPLQVSGPLLNRAQEAVDPNLRAPFFATNSATLPTAFGDVTAYQVLRDDILRFADLDADEHIGRLTQLKLIESGRVGLIQDIGAPTQDPDVIWMAAHVALNFLEWPNPHAGTRTGTRVEDFGNSSCFLRQTVFSEGQMIATGGAVVALANRKTLKPVRIPDNLRERLESAPESNVPPSERYDPGKRIREQT
jgi:acyl-CoA thioester hydrolase